MAQCRHSVNKTMIFILTVMEVAPEATSQAGIGSLWGLKGVGRML